MDRSWCTRKQLPQADGQSAMTFTHSLKSWLAPKMVQGWLKEGSVPSNAPATHQQTSNTTCPRVRVESGPAAHHNAAKYPVETHHLLAPSLSTGPRNSSIIVLSFGSQALLLLQHVLPRTDSVDNALANALIAGELQGLLCAGWMAPEFCKQIPQSLPKPAIGVMHVVVSRNVRAIEAAGLHG